MRRFTFHSLGMKLGQLLSTASTHELTLYTAADDRTFYHRRIIGAFPLPFNGTRVTIVTDGPEGMMEFTWTAERRLARQGEMPLSALKDGT